MIFSNFKVIYRDSKDLMCSLHSWIGQFEICPVNPQIINNKGYDFKGFYIKNPYNLAKNINTGDFIEKFQASYPQTETIQLNSVRALLFNIDNIQ
ncbi:hypothetical protein MXB_3822 [Myxobolus squamalis]|nr:hypothetical protein MXB_3822 [Myxobolus squamalis]